MKSYYKLKYWSEMLNKADLMELSDKKFGIEFFKAKSTKFWDGMLIGLVLGYIPYAWHMYI